MATKVLVIDAGTTNIKALVFDRELAIIDRQAVAAQVDHPQSGWVEQDAQQILVTAKALIDQAVRKHGDQLIAMGLTSQRETSVIWDEAGRVLHSAIVWQDERTKAWCQELVHQDGLEASVRSKTGLSISPYFSASKLRWLLDNVDHAPNVRLGTLDSWLVTKLTGHHQTDFTNASRTLLFNIQTKAWDNDLAQTFGIDLNLLPAVKPSFSEFGAVDIDGRKLPLRAVIGDQQASLYAAGHTPGTVKITLGTGIFPMRLVGSNFELRDGFYTTLAVGEGGQPMYALEAHIAEAAARVSSVLDDPHKLEPVMKELAAQTAEITKQLIDASTSEVIVDGGISQNDLLVAELGRLLGTKITRQSSYEGTAMGVAKLLFDNL